MKTSKQFFLTAFLFFQSIALFAQKNTTMNYDLLWQDVQKAENEGLPETALKKVNEIYAKAKTDKNDGQAIKALIHQIKFADYKEDNVLAQNILRVEKELMEFQPHPNPPQNGGLYPSPHWGEVGRGVLHSMLGEMYWRYYQNNRWKFSDRSKTVNIQLDDIETWSLDKIIEVTMEHYLTSCQLSVDSKNYELRTSNYEPILNAGNEKGRQLRPTLFDFLAHRALDFFKSEEPDVTKPAYAFTVNQEAFLSDAETFAKLKIETKDSLSTKFYALTLLQELTKFHLTDKTPDALVEIDLERLEFVKQYATFPTKSDLYLKALISLEQKTLSSPVSTLVTYRIVAAYLAAGAQYKPLQGDAHKWDVKKAYEFCETAKKRFPNSDGALQCENLQDQILNKTINAQLEDVNVPSKPFRALVQYKNFTELNWRIIKITREEVAEQRKKYARNYDKDREEKFLEYFIGKTALKTGKATLPSDDDYQSHSAEVKLEALPAGEYMVLFSNKSDFSLGKNGLGYAFTTISNLSFTNRNHSDGGTEFYVLNRETGEPVANVKTQIIYRNYNYKTGESFVSNAEGYVKVPYQKANENRTHFSVHFTLANDFFSSEKIERERDSFHQYPGREVGSTNQTFLFLDRAIFRPGQTIYFKGLSIEKSGKKSEILPKRSVTVILRDANYQEVATQTFTTNEYGSFNGTFTAASSGLLGQMTLECTDGSGSTSFSVEEYKRPKFEVTFQKSLPLGEGKGGVSFRLGETVPVEGRAIAYSGANIDGAKVQYRVVRTARYPYWWWCRWGYYPSSPEMEITNGVTQTDAEGKFNVDFTAIPDLSVDKSSDPTFNYTIYADVTDINGETHSNETSVSVGYKALVVGVYAQDIDISKSETPKWAISTSNLSGEFLPAKGQITIHRLQNPERAFRKRLWSQPDKFLFSKEEYYSLFPVDVYSDEDNDLKWPKGKQVLSLNFDSEKEKTFLLDKVLNWERGKYLLEITSKDQYGQEVREVSYFNVFDSKAKTLDLPKIQLFKGIKTNAQPGEKAQVLIGSSAHTNILYEVEQDGKIIYKEWLKRNNEQGTIELAIKEEYRGNITQHFVYVRDSRLYTQSQTISVPYANKDLNISFETFRNKLQPGEKDEWRIKIKGKQADKVAAEMVATLYDASLDEFRANYFSASFWGYDYARLAWASQGGFGSSSSHEFVKKWNPDNYRSVSSPYFDSFNWFGYNFYGYNRFRGVKSEMMRKSSGWAEGEVVEEMIMANSAPAPAMMREESNEMVAEDEPMPQQKSGNTALAKQQLKTQNSQPETKIRTNFNETAFFYPNLKTNENGEVIIAFTVPEALTRWKMLGFAHTKDLQYGFTQNELVTQKDLMVVPNQPRFFREGDKMTFSVKITSLSDQPLKGTSKLEFFDAISGKSVQSLMFKVQSNVEPSTLNFELKPKASTVVEWQIQIPEGIQAITYRVTATAGNFSDGEEMTLPVVTNRTLVTETLPLPIRGKQTKTFRFEKLLNSPPSQGGAGGGTLKNHKYTLEFTSNPAWYAIQALPYLMEYPYECVEQTFSRYYANSIAAHIANSNPRIKQVFDLWRNTPPSQGGDGGGLLSNLEKNQELKSALLEETPWVLQAKDESQRKRNVALLFDLNRMASEEGRALDKIKKAQTPSGGFTWFPGMPEDRWMTQHIVAGLGHLKVMGVKSDGIEDLKTKALEYLDREMQDDYEQLKAAAKRKEIKLEEYHPSYFDIHYLYMRSYFTEQEIKKNHKEAFDYFLGQTKKYWLNDNLYLEGMVALALHRFGQKAATEPIMKSLRERALHSEEMGMYYKQTSGYYWYQAPIETQALLIEVFDEVANDTKAVEDLKVWLLKQKQTTDWKTTKATSEACYALLRRGTDALVYTQIPEIQVGGQPLSLPLPDGERGKALPPAGGEGLGGVEAGTGYFKTSWTAEQIKPEMGEIKITKKDDGVAWGAVYWQYFEQLDKIIPNAFGTETPLKLKKQLFLQQNTDRGPVITPLNSPPYGGGVDLKVGDLVKVRIELRSDRNMEYVHLKDMRAAGFEPVATLSEAKYQDGLWYYESPRDLNTSFFMGYLPKGTYVFEYSLRVSQKGDFSNGISTIQCMYAPEFSSHSDEVRVLVR